MIAFLGLYDLFSEPKKFFKEKYKSWVLPFFMSISSIMFLYLRSVISGKHITPNLSILTDTGIDKYNLSDNYENIFQSINFFFYRMYDLFNYFFQQTNYNFLLSDFYTTNEIYKVIMVALISITVLYKVLTKTNKLMNICLIIIVSNISFYLLNIYPFMPSRHSLIIFLPIITLFAIFATEFFNKIISKKFSTIITYSFLFFTTYSLAINFNIKEVPININDLVDHLEYNNVNRLVLSPCSYEPLLNYYKVEKYKPIYQCGPNIIEKQNFENTIFAVYSINDITKEEAISYIKPFFRNEIKFKKFKLVNKYNQNNRNKHFLSIISYLE